MNIEQHFRSEAARVLGEAKEIVEQADAEGRSLNSDEVAQSEELLSKSAEYREKAQAEEDKRKMLERIESLGTVESNPPEQPKAAAKTPGQAFVQSDAYKSLMERGLDGDWKTPQVEFKAPGDAILTTTGTNPDAIAPQWDNTLYAPDLFQFPRRVAALLAQAQATGNTVFYPVVTGRTPPVGGLETVEGSAKPGADFTFDVVSETLKKLAVFSGVSEEMMQDAPNIAAYIDNQLAVMVEQAEEADIVTTLYTATTATADGSAIGGTEGFDAVREAIATLQLAGFTPDGLLIHPLDSAKLQVTRAIAGTGGYFSGGPYQPGLSNPWGVREVITPSATEGTPLVGAFRTATLYRKGGIRVDASTGYEDYFRKNLIALRAEVRMVVAVHNPEAFVEVDIAAS